MSKHYLPDPAQRVIDECVAEAWRNTENGDAHTEADVAADIARRLDNMYDLSRVDAPPEPTVFDGCPTLVHGICEYCDKRAMRTIVVRERSRDINVAVCTDHVSKAYYMDERGRP